MILLLCEMIILNISLILMYVSSGMVIFGFLLYFILILVGRNKIVSKDECYGEVKEIVSEYDIINMIETKGYFTVYNIKRMVIKLSSKCYYGKDLSSFGISLMEAGLAIVDKKKNKYIDFFRKFFNNLKILYVFSILAVFINHASFNISDAKISLIFMVVFTLISYILLEIKVNGSYYVQECLENNKDINKENRQSISKFMNSLLLTDKLIYLGEILMIMRMILLMFEII